MTTTKIASPRIASRAEWLEQRKALLAEQKEFTRLGDRLELQPSRVRHIHNDSFPRHAKYVYIARKRCDKDTRIFHSNTGSYWPKVADVSSYALPKYVRAVHNPNTICECLHIDLPGPNSL
jgi:hypothetical protein